MSSWNTFLANAKRDLFNQSVTHKILIEKILLEIPKGTKVLEAGCGYAYLSKILADIGYKVTAGDLDEKVLEGAKADIQFLQNPITFQQIDLLKLGSQFQPNTFDVIIHSGVMEHFPDDMIVKAFEEQRKVSKCLIFKIPNSRTKPNKGHFGDERFLTNGHWVGLLNKAGYKDVQVHGGESLPKWTYFLPNIFLTTPSKTKSESLNSILRTLSKWRVLFSRHSIFVCR